MRKNRVLGMLAMAVISFLCTTSLLAQKFPARGYSSITEERARNIVGFLASDLLEGRGAGTRGGTLAAEYIVSMFREWGIEPLGENYFQPFLAVRNENNWLTEADLDLSALLEKGCESRTLRNVIGVIPGKESGVVVVGAHYDHIGIDTTLEGDSCYNGADDNASGVAALLQIARAVTGNRSHRCVCSVVLDLPYQSSSPTCHTHHLRTEPHSSTRPRWVFYAAHSYRQ